MKFVLEKHFLSNVNWYISDAFLLIIRLEFENDPAKNKTPNKVEDVMA